MKPANKLNRKNVLLQQEGGTPKKLPAQPCGAEFTTEGSSGHMGYTGDKDGHPTTDELLAVILNAYINAHQTAKGFCQLLGEGGCKKVEFVRYASIKFLYGSDTPPAGKWIQIDIVIVWRCVKP